MKNEILFPLWMLFELIKITFNVEVILYNSLLNDVNKFKSEMNDLFKFSGEIDSSISIVGLKLSNINVCKPKFTNKKNIVVKNLFHPPIYFLQ